MELKGLKTIDGSTSDWLSLTSGPRSLVKYWFSVQMHEVLFSFVYALTSAKFLFFSMYRIVLKVAGPRKNPIKGTKTKSLFRDGVARKPYPILWQLHITVTWDYPTGVNVACVQTPHPHRKNPIFLERRGGGAPTHWLGCMLHGRKIKPYIKRQG